MADIYDQYLPAYGTPLQLRDEDKTFLRDLVGASPTDDLVFDICRIDGTATPQSSTPGTGLTSASVGPQCATCDAAEANNPTLFAFLVRRTNASRWLWTALG